MLANYLNLILLVGGIVTALTGLLHAVAPIKSQILFYKQSTNEPVGNMFVRLWGISVLTTGLFMIFASQIPTLAIAVALAAAFSKGLLSVAVFCAENGKMRSPMKVMMVGDFGMAILLILAVI